MTSTRPKGRSQATRAGIAAFVGTAIEWYDFYIYGLAAALVLGPLFFPELNPALGAISAFATFGVAYVMRPLGAIIFGHIGDRVGRKTSLVMTLLLMGVSTFAVGLLPTYDTIGTLAPILLVLCRLVQGLSAGGEWGGAVLIASEHASKRGFVSAGAWAQQGSPAGNVLASGVFVLVNLMPDEQFMSFGWRIPFLLSAALVVVGLVIRFKLEESPAFVQAKEQNATTRVPLVHVLRTAWPVVLLGAASTAVATTAYPLLQVFGLNWLTTDLDVARSLVLNAILVMSLTQFFVQPLCAPLALRFQPISVIKVVLAACIVIIPAGWLLLATGATVGIFTGMILIVVPVSLVYGLLGGFLAAAFPAEVRYTGTGISYQLGAMVFSSISPVLAAVFMASTGSIWTVIAMQVAYVVMSLVAFVWLSRMTGAGRSEHNAPHPAAGSGNEQPRLIRAD